MHMCKICCYANTLGAPRTGLHTWRVPFIDLAAVDIFLTFMGAIGVALYVTTHNRCCATLMIFGLFWFLGTMLHIIFCVHTPLVDALL
jgi:hypothetical protein